MPPVALKPLQVAAATLLCATTLSAQTPAPDTLRGRVLDARARTPVPGALVSLIPAGTPDAQATARAVTDGEGRFAFVGLAAGPYRLGVEAFGYSAAAEQVVEYRGGLRALDVSVLPSPLEAGGIDVVVTRPAVVRGQTQVVSGIVLDGASEEPLSELEIVLRNVHGEVMGRTTSDGDGHFLFGVSRGGLYRLHLSRMGYAEGAATEVAVAPGQDVYVELRATPSPFGLGEIRVSAPHELPVLEAAGFYRRRELGRGDFYGPREVERMHGMFSSHLLRQLEDITVMGKQMWIRGTVGPGGQPCRPTVVLDGLELREAHIDELATKRMIRAVEVYSHAGDIPQQWRGPMTCGVVAIWTE